MYQFEMDDPVDSNIISEIITSQKKLNSKSQALVYDYLVRNSHIEISIEYKKKFGPFEHLSGLTLESVTELYIKSRNKKEK